MGDFNIVLGAQEYTSNSPSHNLAVDKFRSFISSIDLFDIEPSGNPYTWSIRCSPAGYMAAHLDCALANQGFLDGGGRELVNSA